MLANLRDLVKFETYKLSELFFRSLKMVQIIPRYQLSPSFRNNEQERFTLDQKAVCEYIMDVGCRKDCHKKESK